MARERNPRVVLLERLTKIRSEMSKLQGYWNWAGKSTVYDSSCRDQDGWGTRRPHTPEEYPENDPTEWATVASWAAHWASELRKIEIDARNRGGM